ncbi:hypothetical protein BTO30_01495 [Domibacillus antri]|uniref:Uncharacterized protein n=1 Tax=Domibacillus antri TaxID=1714264 RepID=A0A1Q8QA17_9BACI|nr:hypothetical protein BTO30_01495 [Domibacillus antri]
MAFKLLDVFASMIGAASNLLIISETEETAFVRVQSNTDIQAIRGTFKAEKTERRFLNGNWN